MGRGGGGGDGLEVLNTYYSFDYDSNLLSWSSMSNFMFKNSFFIFYVFSYNVEFLLVIVISNFYIFSVVIEV